MALGSYEINVVVGGMPQNIATAFGKLSEQLIGAEYTPIAYLGSQVVNGTNHAVLAEQLITTGKDTKNVVVVIFNEKPVKDALPEVTLVNIERVLESGAPIGGIKVEPTTNMPEDALKDFNEVMEGFLGSKVEPFAYLGSQVVKGTNYYFAAELTPVVQNPKSSVAIVVVNALSDQVSFVDILGGQYDGVAAGYAFTWLKRTNKLSVGAPLGEWP